MCLRNQCLRMIQAMSEGELAFLETMEGGRLWIEGEDGSWYAGLDVWYNPDLLAHWTELENLRAEVARKEYYLLSMTDLSFRPAWVPKWVPKRGSLKKNW